jgi:hypothetical protein
MKFDYSVPGQVKIDMRDYVADMVDDFPIVLEETDVEKYAAPSDLFAEGKDDKLTRTDAETFHTFVAKGLFVCKRARPDIHQVISLLSTRVKAPNKSDMDKLVHLLKYLNGTLEDVLTLSADDLHIMMWYVDGSFAVHPDFRSHTGGALTMGKGCPISISSKHKINTKSSTEAEIVSADDCATKILWSKLFMEAQGYGIEKNILYQDNKSAILLEENGKKSSSKRTRAMNIRYFFLTDQIEKGNLVVEYCPTDEMIADYFTKPLVGSKFIKFKRAIMGQD